jgi:hypothetical protein
MRFRASDLRPHGWTPPQTLHIPDRCGCTTEYLPVPAADGWWDLVPIWDPRRCKACFPPRTGLGFRSAPSTSACAPGMEPLRRTNVLTRRCRFKDWVDVQLRLRAKPIYSWLPGDYRTCDEIEEAFRANQAMLPCT